MASDSGIQTYLDAILEATYGSEVRTAIHNSIASCYADVSNGVTNLDNALSQVDTALSGISDAVADASAAVEDANNAKEQFAEAAQAYEQAYTEGNTYIQQLTTLKNQASTSASNAASSATAASGSASSASQSATQATNALSAIQEYDIDGMDDRLEALEGLESTLGGIETRVSGYADAIDIDRQTVQTLYDDIFVNYDIPALKQSIQETLTGINTVSGYVGTFDEYNSRFSGYAETFSGYNNTFSGYSTEFNNFINSIDTLRDELTGIKTDTGTIRDDVNRTKAAIDLINFEQIATDANSAMQQANEALDEINAVWQLIDEASLRDTLEQMTQAVQDTEAAADRAETAVGDLSESIDAANTAANAANSKVLELNTLQTSLGIIQSTWENTLNPTIQSNLNAITQAVNSANEASTTAISVSETVSSLLTDVQAIDSDWTTRRDQMDDYLEDSQTALTSLESATDSIDNMTVSSESVPYTSPCGAEITDVDGHKNIHFLIQQGEPGPGNVIKGATYSSLSALQADITNPNVGDQYSVGTSTPYNIYRWTGSAWEDQGPYGVSVNSLSNSDIDTIYGGGSVSDTSKYLNGTGLKHFVESNLADALGDKVDAVSGKGLSTNDFTNEYKTSVDNLQTSIENKVDKVNGKGLSTNDFTNVLKNKITTNETNIGLLTNGKLDSDFSTFTSFIGSEWTSGLIAIRYGSSMYQLSGSKLINDIATSSNLVTGSQIATLAETISYLGTSMPSGGGADISSTIETVVREWLDEHQQEIEAGFNVEIVNNSLIFTDDDTEEEA